jgi:hypothetical protein
VNISKVNWLPLSVMIDLGTQNQLKISCMNYIAFTVVILATGLASMHFMDLSMATKRYATMPFTSLNGPKMSKHQVENG